MTGPWTANERRILRRDYPTQTVTAVAATLGRSRSSVIRMVGRMGIGKRIVEAAPRPRRRYESPFPLIGPPSFLAKVCIYDREIAAEMIAVRADAVAAAIQAGCGYEPTETSRFTRELKPADKAKQVKAELDELREAWGRWIRKAGPAPWIEGFSQGKVDTQTEQPEC